MRVKKRYKVLSALIISLIVSLVLPHPVYAYTERYDTSWKTIDLGRGCKLVPTTEKTSAVYDGNYIRHTAYTAYLYIPKSLGKLKYVPTDWCYFGYHFRRRFPKALLFGSLGPANTRGSARFYFIPVAAETEENGYYKIPIHSFTIIHWDGPNGKSDPNDTASAEGPLQFDEYEDQWYSAGGTTYPARESGHLIGCAAIYDSDDYHTANLWKMTNPFDTYFYHYSYAGHSDDDETGVKVMMGPYLDAINMVEPHVHSWQTATASVNNGIRTKADCTNAATYYRKCSGCSELDTSQWNAVGSPLGHSWGSWIVDRDSDVYSQGTKHRVCTRDHSHTESGLIDKKSFTIYSGASPNTPISAIYLGGTKIMSAASGSLKLVK